jgi:Protein of unknown function (DUF2530)
VSHEELDPVKVDLRLVLAVGTGLWLVVLIVLAAFNQALADAGLLWWLHTAIVGSALGGVALLIVRS